MIPDRSSPDTVSLLPFRYGRLLVITRDLYIGRAIQQYGEYSEGEVELWRVLLEPTHIVADIGANIGAHTVALAQMVPQGAVIAFEPGRYLYHLLCGNVALNGLTNVIAKQCAIGATNGQVIVPAVDYTLPINYGGFALGNHTEGSPVPLVRLDDLLPRADFLKVDVEGMEKQVFEGAQRLIHTYRPILYFENNAGDHRQPLIEYVQGMGYDVWWHCPPLFNPGNYKANPVNTYEGIASFNMLALPSHPDNTKYGLGPPISRVA